MAEPSQISALVVDDDDDVRALVVLHLLMSGTVVKEAATVDEGLALVDAWVPDVVVTDLNFGNDSGERIVRHCRAVDRPVILMTASAETRDLSPDLREGLVIMRKPFGLDDLTAAIDGLIGGERSDG